MSKLLFNHTTGALSALDLQMIMHVPAGGNWQNIPTTIPSKRLEQIRASGGRTTYYGRLQWNKPAYTITTYFNRPGNGCNIHPNDSSSVSPQHRLLSFREAARLQSFPDSFRFTGPKTSIYKQIGNAVPPLLAFAMAKQIKGNTALDLFCGSGGLSCGLEMAGFEVVAGLDNDKHSINTWKANHKGIGILGDIGTNQVRINLYESVIKVLNGRELDIIAGGPPCQGFSTAGWRESDDPRNKLWRHYLEVVMHLKPKYFIIENVAGLLSATQQGSKVLELITLEFKKLGYNISYKKLNAEDYGVPQRRRRVFIVGSRQDQPEFVFPATKTYEPVTVKEAIFNLPSLGVKDGLEEMEWHPQAPLSLFEQWASGEISVDQFLMNRATAH